MDCGFGGAARGDDGVDDDGQRGDGGAGAGGEVVVVFDGLEGGFVAEETEVVDGDGEGEDGFEGWLAEGSANTFLYTKFGGREEGQSGLRSGACLTYLEP